MPLSVKAKTFTGQAYDLSLDGPSSSVTDLQESISTASGITPDRQTILFKGQVLEPGSNLSDYSLTDGSIISVVRRIGKASAPTKSASSASAPPPLASAPVETDAEAAPQPPSLDEMMRSLNMGAGAASGAPPMPDFSTLMGGGPGGTGPPASMEQLFAQLPQMMNGLMGSPLLRDYLNNSEKQEQSREAILSNPLMKSLLESDPEFAKVVNDPDRWRESMEAAKGIFSADPSTGAAQEVSESASRAVPESITKPAGTTVSRRSAADLAPPGIDIKKLSESYGHALGQSLINSGLGLDPDLVIRGLRTAVDGKPFPMALPEYERSMASLQNIASEFLTKANLEDANNFFSELKSDGSAIVLEEGKIAYEKTEEEPEASAPAAEEKSTVLVILSARLLDGRHFFTCPAADETGDSVHPLTLPLETAPPALAKGIVGMRESESRMLYVHPTACDGMSEMFGDLLPPNALLIFDLQLVSADAPNDEEGEEQDL